MLPARHLLAQKMNVYGKTAIHQQWQILCVAAAGCHVAINCVYTSSSSRPHAWTRKYSCKQPDRRAQAKKTCKLFKACYLVVYVAILTICSGRIDLPVSNSGLLHFAFGQAFGCLAFYQDSLITTASRQRSQDLANITEPIGRYPKSRAKGSDDNLTGLRLGEQLWSAFISKLLETFRLI